MAVRAETPDTFGSQLTATVQTGAASHPASTITRTNATVTSNPSGVSWAGLTWSDSADAVFGIHYYLITAEGSDGVAKTFRAYYDWNRGTSLPRGGYALWGLNDGVEYTATVRAVNWAGDLGEPYNPLTFTTVPATQEHADVGCRRRADLHLGGAGRAGRPVLAGGRRLAEVEREDRQPRRLPVYVNDVALQPAAGGLDQVNAVATTTGTTFEVPTGAWPVGDGLHAPGRSWLRRPQVRLRLGWPGRVDRLHWDQQHRSATQPDHFRQVVRPRSAGHDPRGGRRGARAGHQRCPSARRGSLHGAVLEPTPHRARSRCGRAGRRKGRSRRPGDSSWPPTRTTTSR